MIDYDDYYHDEIDQSVVRSKLNLSQGSNALGTKHFKLNSLYGEREKTRSKLISNSRPAKTSSVVSMKIADKSLEKLLNDEPYSEGKAQIK